MQPVLMRVFPAGGGVSLLPKGHRLPWLSFPRVCGGEPGKPSDGLKNRRFSPRVRG